MDRSILFQISIKKFGNWPAKAARLQPAGKDLSWHFEVEGGAP